jgi:N-methylhydantoinase A/oxoprolinase/acetone carboxylase beta subunit
MHACALADLVGMGTVIVPARAGVLSAVGLLGAPVQHDVVRSWAGGDSRGALDRLARDTAASMRDHGDVEVVTAVDCRYRGQSHELTVPTPDDFHAEHARRNGYSRQHEPVEVVALRASARVASPVDTDALPSRDRSAVRGPVVVSEADCTIWVPDGWSGEPGRAGALVLRRA